MPERLDDALVESSLLALPLWTGDSSAISRTVDASGTEADRLVAAIEKTAEAMNHHPDVERGEGQLRIMLSTHSAGGVTERDLSMASHIEDLVAQTTQAPTEHAQHTVTVDDGESSSPQQERGPESEALIGAPSTSGGSPVVPLPSDQPGQPEPGVAEEQDRPTVPESQ